MRNPISPFIIEKFPDFIKNEYKQLSRFLSDFYNFLEEEGNPLEVLSSFQENTKICNQVDIYIDKFLEEIGFNIKKNLAISKHDLILHLRDFYLSRGSVNSFKFLFKILFEVDITIDYPRKKLLVTSGATYSQRFFLFVSNNSESTIQYEKILQSLLNYSVQIQGISSKSIYNVENITIKYSRGISFLQIQINEYNNLFEIGEGVRIYNDLGNEIYEEIVEVISVNIVNPGYGYAIGDKINISNTLLKGDAAVSKLSYGKIDNIFIQNGGTGYAIDDKIFAKKNTEGHSFSARVNEVDNSNNYLSIPSDSSLQLESGNWTIECWIMNSNNYSESVIASNYNLVLNRGWTLKINNTNKIVFEQFSAISTQTFTSHSRLNINKWNHIAVTRNNDKIMIFINGNHVNEDTVVSTPVSSENIFIGIRKDGKSPFIGYMNELCVTKGTARYISDFTPEKTFYDSGDPLYSDISLLLHFNELVGSITFNDSSSSNKTVTSHGKIFSTNETSSIGDKSIFFTGTGSISSIEILNGGYNYNIIPVLSITSRYGQGAVITSESSSIGQIVDIEFFSPFVGSNQNNKVVTINSKYGTNAILEVLNQSVYEEPSSLKTFEGVLGFNCTLLDSYYFQQFSYEIKSSVSRHEYDSIINEWLHPLGFSRFAILDINYSDFLFDRKELTESFILGVVKIIYNLADYSMDESSSSFNLLKICVSKDDRLLLNSQSNLNTFKESENFKQRNDYWDYLVVVDPRSNPSEVTSDIGLLSRQRIDDDSLTMQRALDAEITVIII